jgi:hypothetical protein
MVQTNPKHNVAKKSEMICDPEHSLESSSIQDYLSGNNLHMPSINIPSLISPRRIPMKFSVKKDKKKSQLRPMEEGGDTQRTISKGKVPMLDFSNIRKIENIVPNKMDMPNGNLELEEFDNKSEWMSRLNESEICIVGYPETMESEIDITSKQWIINRYQFF